MHSLLAKRSLEALLLDDTPQTNNDSSNSGEERGVICGLVAAQSIRAIPVAAWANDGVLVKDAAVEQIEDVATDDRRKSHHSPVLREAADSEDVGDKRWENSEEESICYACKCGDGN